MSFAQFWARLRSHFAPFFDLRAWVVLIGLTAIYLMLVDPAMFKAVASWAPQWLMFPALVVIVCRYYFPMIVLARLMPMVEQGNVAAAIVVASIVTFVPLGLISLSLFARVG